MSHLQSSQGLEICCIILLFYLDTQERRPSIVVDHLCSVDGISRSQMQMGMSTTKQVDVDGGISTQVDAAQLDITDLQIINHESNS